MKEIALERDYKIDILRFIAIICIILAHCNPPGIIFVLRNFDVTLMVLLMGASYYISSGSTELNYINYIKKRFNRLIVPTWKFLTIFFVIFYCISLFLNLQFVFNIKTIVRSYLLVDGIGYVWIMRVFFLVAILNPIILKISNKIKSNLKYFLLLLSIYIIYLVTIFINSRLNGVIRFLFENILIVSIGWGLIASIGVRIKRLSKKELIIYSIIFLSIFVLLMIKYEFKSTQNFKYPPTMYYMSYGISVSFMLLILMDCKFIYNILNNSFVKYIARNSLWLYFWHIIPIFLLKQYKDYFIKININFVTRFIFIFTFALIVTIIQDKIKLFIKRKCK